MSELELVTSPSFTLPSMTKKSTISSRMNWPGEGSKYVAKEDMEQFVINTGTTMMHLCSAINWDSHDMVCLHSYKSLYCSNVFTVGAIAVSSGAFGDDLQSAVLYGVNCTGNETEVPGCTFSLNGTCSEHSASVMCQGKVSLYWF